MKEIEQEIRALSSEDKVELLRSLIAELDAPADPNVERVIGVLLEHPEMGARVDENLRHFVLRKFPFSIVYAIVGDLIYIVAVAHGSREPDYWRFRFRVQDR